MGPLKISLLFFLCRRNYCTEVSIYPFSLYPFTKCAYPQHCFICLNVNKLSLVKNRSSQFHVIARSPRYNRQSFCPLWNRYIYLISLFFPSSFPPLLLPFLPSLHPFFFIYSLMTSNSHSRFMFQTYFISYFFSCVLLTKSWTHLAFPQICSELPYPGFAHDLPLT